MRGDGEQRTERMERRKKISGRERNRERKGKGVNEQQKYVKVIGKKRPCTVICDGECVGAGAGVDERVPVGVGGEPGDGPARRHGDVVCSVVDGERGVRVAPRRGPERHRLAVEAHRRRVAFLGHDRQIVAEVETILRVRHGTGSLGRRVNGSFGSSFTSGSPGHHFDPV